jgi:hypothetical protein
MIHIIYYVGKRIGAGITILCLSVNSNSARAQGNQVEISVQKFLRTGIAFFPSQYKFSIATETDGNLLWIPWSEPIEAENTTTSFNLNLTAYRLYLTSAGDGDVLRKNAINIRFRKSPTRIATANFNSEATAVSGSYLFIPGSDKHRIFRKKNRNRFTETASFSAHKFHFTQAFPLEQGLLFLACLYNYHRLDDTARFKLAVYDPEKEQFTASIFHNNYPGIEFTHLPNHLIDARKNEIAVAQTLTYKIHFYNKNLRCIDSISRQIDDWVSWDQDLHGKKYGIYVKSLISDILKIDNHISRIERINYLNDSTLLVLYRMPGADSTDTRVIDIWQRKRTTWTPAVTGQRFTFRHSPEDTISRANYQPNLTVSTPILMNDSQILTISIGGNPPNKPMTRSEYKSLAEKQSSKEELMYNVVTYKWRLK